MICDYCTPNKHGDRKPLSVDSYHLSNKNLGYNRIKKEVLKIYRKRQNKRKYFIGLHTKDVMENGNMLRNNGFNFQIEINYCPMCGKDLNKKAVSGN